MACVERHDHFTPLQLVPWYEPLVKEVEGEVSESKFSAKEKNGSTGVRKSRSVIDTASALRRKGVAVFNQAHHKNWMALKIVFWLSGETRDPVLKQQNDRTPRDMRMMHLSCTSVTKNVMHEEIYKGLI